MSVAPGGQQHRWWEMRLVVYRHQVLEQIMFNLFAITKKPLKRRLFYPLLSLLVALGLCLGSTHPAPAFSWFDLLRPAIQAIQLSNMSDKQEVALGEQINQQVKEEVKLYSDRDRRVNAYINEIGQRLARQSSRPPTEDYKYTFQVVDDDSVNAFASMGGFVYVHTGLLKAADNEAQLASVLAHEIAHITERHVIKQMRQMAVASGLASAAGIDNNTAVQLGVELALRLPHSRQAEYEADRVGLQMLGSAGYAQSAAIEFMKKLLEGPSPPTFLSTHPGTPDRIQALSDNLNPAFANQGHGLNEADYKANIKPVLR